MSFEQGTRDVVIEPTRDGVAGPQSRAAGAHRPVGAVVVIAALIVLSPLAFGWLAFLANLPAGDGAWMAPFSGSLVSVGLAGAALWGLWRRDARHAANPALAAGTADANSQRLQARAREASEQAETVARLAGCAYWLQDANFVYTAIDLPPSVPRLAMTGWLGRQRWSQGAVPVSLPDWRSHLAALDQRLPFRDIVFSRRLADGSTIFVAESGEPRFSESGEFLGYRGVSREVTAETVAQNLRSLAIAAVRACTEPVLLIESRPSSPHAWSVIWANGAACDMLQRTESELMEADVASLFGRVSHEAVPHVADALLRGQTLRMRAQVARKYGDLRLAELRCVPVQRGAGPHRQAALLITDLSSDIERAEGQRALIERLRRRMADRTLELEATARELESFSYSVSHDLRAPLRAVEGFARILDEDYGAQLDRVGHEHLNRILGAASRMNQMIDALLSLARLSAQPIVAEPIDLSRLAGQAIEDIAADEPERRVEVHIRPGLRAAGDRALMRVVLDNLLSNAWKYTSRTAAARIEVRAEVGEQGTVYCVADNGAGFDMRYADRLFGVFQRLHSPSEFPGTGVGLATVQRILRRHGGRIWAESEPGEGARFFFTLWEKRPAGDEAEARVEGHAESGSEQDGVPPT